jgi:hypothetical protein
MDGGRPGRCRDRLRRRSIRPQARCQNAKFGSAISGDSSGINNEVEIRLSLVPIPNERCEEIAPLIGNMFALTKRGCMTLEGDLQPAMANLQYLKDLLVLPRRLRKESNRYRPRSSLATHEKAGEHTACVGHPFAAPSRI